MTKQQKHILAVEDDTDIQQIISLYVTNAGYSIDFVNSAKAMYAYLKSSDKPDLILLDLGLPDADGIEITEQIRAFSTVPIIIVTGRTSHQDKITALSLGADDYLTKPFDPKELILRIEKLLARSSSTFKDRRAARDRRERRTNTALPARPQAVPGRREKPLLLIALGVVLALGLGLALYSAVEKPVREANVPEAEVTEAQPTAEPDNPVSISVTATCQGADAIFTVTNIAERWPAPGEVRIYIVSSQATVLRRRLLLSLNQRATFRVKTGQDANYASRNTGSDGIGLWVKPDWYDRSFKYDATVNCGQ